MDCLVTHAGAVVGRAELQPADDDASARALTGSMVPNTAYEAIREVCQRLTRVMVGQMQASATSSAPAPGDGHLATPPDFEQMLGALLAVQSLDLRLTTLDGAPIATDQVIIQDVSPMRAGRADVTTGEEAPNAVVIIAALA